MRNILLIWLALTLAFTIHAGDHKGKHVLFLAGKDSHGWGQHSHLASTSLIQKAWMQAVPGTKSTLIRRWPTKEEFEHADVLVMYLDGYAYHLANKRLNDLEVFMNRGGGVVSIHWATGMGSNPKEKAHARELMGANFEHGYSVESRTWSAHFESFDDHPVVSGVKPFALVDEFYFFMHEVKPNAPGLNFVLKDHPPSRIVSKHLKLAYESAVVKKDLQHTAWAYKRPKGGRAFGYTGGHFHWNWANDDLRKMIVNAIAWTGGLEIPKTGFASSRPDAKAMMENVTGKNPGWSVEMLQPHLDRINDCKATDWRRVK